MSLTNEEEARMKDTRFHFDFRNFPWAFASVFDAIDSYCELGYQYKIMFAIYEKKYNNKKLVFFSLCCHTRTLGKVKDRRLKAQKGSNCPVNVRFQWNEKTMMYERLKEFKLVHSHHLDLGENNVLVPEV